MSGLSPPFSHFPVFYFVFLPPPPPCVQLIRDVEGALWSRYDERRRGSRLRLTSLLFSFFSYTSKSHVKGALFRFFFSLQLFQFFLLPSVGCAKIEWNRKLLYSFFLPFSPLFFLGPPSPPLSSRERDLLSPFPPPPLYPGAEDEEAIPFPSSSLLF